MGLALWREAGKEIGLGAEERAKTVMLWEGDMVGLFGDKAHAIHKKKQ